MSFLFPYDIGYKLRCLLGIPLGYHVNSRLENAESDPYVCGHIFFF